MGCESAPVGYLSTDSRQAPDELACNRRRDRADLAKRDRRRVRSLAARSRRAPASTPG